MSQCADFEFRVTQAFLFYSLLVFVWAHFWKKDGVGISPGEVARCSKEEAEYLTQAKNSAEGAESQDLLAADGPPPFSLTIWWAVISQPVTIGMTLFTVIDGMSVHGAYSCNPYG